MPLVLDISLEMRGVGQDEVLGIQLIALQGYRVTDGLANIVQILCGAMKLLITRRRQGRGRGRGRGRRRRRRNDETANRFAAVQINTLLHMRSHYPLP